MQRGERELPLSLNTRRQRRLAIRTLAKHVLEQRGLPDAGLSPDPQRATLTSPHVVDHLVEYPTLPTPVQQHVANPRDLGRVDRGRIKYLGLIHAAATPESRGIAQPQVLAWDAPELSISRDNA